MNLTRKEFPAAQVYSWDNMMLWICICAALSVIAVFFTNMVGEAGWVAIFILLPLIPIWLIFRYVLNSKVVFENDYVEKRTLLGNTRINLQDVRTWGVYTNFAGAIGSYIMKPEDVIEKGPLADSFIFMTIESTFNPYSYGYDDTITLQYRKDAYEYISAILLQATGRDAMRSSY